MRGERSAERGSGRKELMHSVRSAIVEVERSGMVRVEGKESPGKDESRTLTVCDMAAVVISEFFCSFITTVKVYPVKQELDNRTENTEWRCSVCDVVGF